MDSRWNAYRVHYLFVDCAQILFNRIEAPQDLVFFSGIHLLNCAAYFDRGNLTVSINTPIFSSMVKASCRYRLRQTYLNFSFTPESIRKEDFASLCSLKHSHTLSDSLALSRSYLLHHDLTEHCLLAIRSLLVQPIFVTEACLSPSFAYCHYPNDSEQIIDNNLYDIPLLLNELSLFKFHTNPFLFEIGTYVWYN